MHRIDTPGNLGNTFTEGDPDHGVPATVVGDDFMNAVQEELCNAITGSGIALSKPNNSQLLAAIRLITKPVGTVELRYDNTSPATLYGGTWVEFGQGRMLIGRLASDSDFDTVGGTGGEKTHTLTNAEIPAVPFKDRYYIENSVRLSGATQTLSSGGINASLGNQDTDSDNNTFLYANATIDGGGEAHNNMPPYVVVRMWRRTA